MEAAIQQVLWAEELALECLVGLADDWVVAVRIVVQLLEQRGGSLAWRVGFVAQWGTVLGTMDLVAVRALRKTVSMVLLVQQPLLTVIRITPSGRRVTFL